MSESSTAGPESGLQALADDVRRANDRAAVLRVLHEYAEALDYGLPEQFVACFTNDAVFEIRFPEPVPADYPARGGRLTAQAVQYVGTEEIAEFFAQHTHSPAAAHKHLVANAIVDVVGDTASVRSYFVRIDVTPNGDVFTRTYGRYTDELRRVGSGWKICRRIGEPDAVDLRAIRLRG